MIQKNKELAKLFIHELFGKQRTELIDDIIHVDYHLAKHETMVLEMDPEFITKQGIESFKTRFEYWKRVIPKITYEITSLIAEDEFVSVHWIAKIHYTGSVHLDVELEDMKTAGTHFFVIRDAKIWQTNLISDFITPLFVQGALIVKQDVNEKTKFYIENLQKMGFLPKVRSQR